MGASDALTLTHDYVFAGDHASVDVLSGDAASDSKNSPRFVESEELDTVPKRQFKTAEIADAVMGTEAPISPSDIQSLIPKNVKDPLSGFTPPCDEGSDQCAQPVAADEETPEETTSESSQQVYWLYYITSLAGKYFRFSCLQMKT